MKETVKKKKRYKMVRLIFYYDAMGNLMVKTINYYSILACLPGQKKAEGIVLPVMFVWKRL